MAEYYICTSVMLIRTAEAGVSDFDENLIRLEIFLGDGLIDLAFLRALENCELNHCCGIAVAFRCDLVRRWKFRELNVRCEM